jgi:hypothetical protein
MNFKVIKIQKSWSAGGRTWHIIVDADRGEAGIAYEVEAACENDPGGQSNGYSYEWEVETDPKVVKDVLLAEDKNMVESIKRMRTRMIAIREELIRMDQA